MPVVAVLPDLLADSETVTVMALTALVVLEILLRHTGFAQPDAVDVDER